VRANRYNTFMAQKVVEYVLLGDDVAKRLTEEVNARLRAGWSLYGSPMCWGVVGQYGPEGTIYQAMVKYDTT
jgi:hypothetical protein